MMLFRRWLAPSGSLLQFGKLSSALELHSSVCYKSDDATPEPETVTEDTEADKKLVKRYKINQGGDINTVSLLGTVIGIKFFPMQSKPERDWAALFIRTRSMKKLSPETNESAPHTPIVDLATAVDTSGSPFSRPYSSTSARVHVFDPRILHNARRAMVGDRLFVSGFLSYYKRPGTGDADSAGSDSGTFVPKICAVVAQRIVFMGQDPSEPEDFPAENPQNVELE
ncbi:hypothetical protein FGIG_07828 [Fasciola gigantica]|uniref:Uncharacterized protein n=1 Tax=Fasciola gigantica TaxID=46835 RepID=A0A504YIN0_FASGI|nr:hypothetical protein FGIG_07828 [Fasciola gigantica]